MLLMWMLFFGSSVMASCAIAQVVSHRLPTMASRVRAQVRSCGICGGQSGTGAGFLRVTRFLLSILIPPTAPHSSSSSSVIRGWHNRPTSGRHTKWTQSRSTPRNLVHQSAEMTKLKLKWRTLCLESCYHVHNTQQFNPNTRHLNNIHPFTPITLIFISILTTHLHLSPPSNSTLEISWPNFYVHFSFPICVLFCHRFLLVCW
jgi:hypothetical protein